ncbi:dihydrofolate reductase family protein [Candidatus Nitrosocosmicus sp. T]
MISDEIAKLKRQDGKDILVYGDASFNSSLIKEKLVDKFYLLVVPIVFGSGKTIFKELRDPKTYIDRIQGV